MSTTTSVSSTPSTNAELMARRRAALPAGLGQTHEIFVQHADNAEVWDVEGQRYLDFAGGISGPATGWMPITSPTNFTISKNMALMKLRFETG